MDRRPTLALLLGDPAGIGPEIAVKLLAERTALAPASVLLLSDPAMIEAGERVAGARVPAEVRVQPLELLQGAPVQLGQPTPATGRAALRALEAAVDAVRRREAQGIVFAPLNKQAMKLAGLSHEDELRLLQSLFAVQGFVCEFNVTGDLWTSRVTSHIPLRDVADALSIDAICDAIAILDSNLRTAGVAQPRIGVAGLNPHAGDGGAYGVEELELIAPAVRRMRERNLDVQGPFPADTIFVSARDGKFDAVVSMYHDQGQIAMKLLGFERGVTLLGGLPVPVATCASGTAYDIAGRGVARHEGLWRAFELAARMAQAV